MKRERYTEEQIISNLKEHEAENRKLELLPRYVPELNPGEQIWNYCKSRELAYFGPTDITKLRSSAHCGLRACGGTEH